jgi:hypothetical protein
MDGMTPCFDLNERKEKMKKHLKTLTALGLICLLLPSVHAEDALKKEDNSIPKDSSQNFVKDKIAAPVFEEKTNWTDAKNGLTFFQIRPHLNDIERRHLGGLIDKAVERMFANEIKKYQESLPVSERNKKLPKTQYILGHLWLSSVKHLSPEEYKTIAYLLDVGMKQKYGASSSKEQNAHQPLPPMPKPDRTLSPKEQEDSTHQFKWMLGSTWLSVCPYLKDEDYKKFSDMIFLGFDRYVTSQSAQNK